MSEELVNRVADSGLKNLNLNDYYPKEEIIALDIKPWLFQGLLLKEKEFRQHLKEHDWTAYSDKILAVHCSSDAIIPNWAWMLLAKEAAAAGARIHFGDKTAAVEAEIINALHALNLSQFDDQRILVNGCGEKEITAKLYLEISKILIPHVKSLMFGEACSNVPVYKRKK